MTLRLKPLLFFVLLLFYPAVTRANEPAFDPQHALYTEVLKVFVEDGGVDYARLKKEPHLLKQYLSSLSRVGQSEFQLWEDDRQLAYLINLYNAATLQLIVDHYPVESIKDIGSFLKGPWLQPVVPLFGETITLNRLEHRIIRTDYKEPRTHIALVCAANGCPPLRREAYMEKVLEHQLDDQAKIFLNMRKGLQIDPESSIVFLSSIFKWYGKDFTETYHMKTSKGDPLGKFSKHERAVVHFVSNYVSDDHKRYLLDGKYRIKYLDYDWSLNNRKAEP